MRKTVALLVVAALAAALWIGCGDEDRVPYLTTVAASQTCGVAPLVVQFVASASGGDPLDDPTSANDYLEINWNFGDNSAPSTGSLVYHVYENPGEYQIEVRVKDKDGEGAPRNLSLLVRADSLTIRAYPDTVVFGCQAVPLTVYADACGWDKNASTESYEQRFLYRWEVTVDDSLWVFTNRAPTIAFCSEPDTHRVVLSVTDDQFSLVRRDTLAIVVLDNPAPVTLDDAYSLTVAPDEVLDVAAPGVLTNDSSAGACALTVSLVANTGPSQSESFTLRPDGSFTYDPRDNAGGTDSFQYRVSNGCSSTVGTVTLTLLVPMQ